LKVVNVCVSPMKASMCIPIWQK